ncbi:hypothetical protein [Streptomyces sp.]|uniref:hypothetical protein n=1 Tax=Streptomyces sp. TaxID=1931 RepID=UPI002F3E2173
MARGIPSWAVVSGLTAAAMVGVSVLALQASGVPTKNPAAASPTRHPATSRPYTPPPPPPVPALSGTGKRIVYSLGQRRVWIVPVTGRPVRTFVVQPGTVPAKPGIHFVTGRTPSTVGADGANVEHIVYFEYTAETWVAFSSPTDDRLVKPDPSLRMGGIRAHRKDGAAIWNATVVGSTVVVVR